MPDLWSLARDKSSNKVKNKNMGIQEEDGEATDEEEQESQESDAWLNLDQGKLQQEGASQKELGHPRP